MKPVRRTQAIAPFGPGAMVDFPGPVSLIHAGIQAWPFDRNLPEHREFMVEDEPRLARRLDVDFFVLPPDFRRPQRNAGRMENQNLKLPFLRFPLWHVCPIPSCGKMHRGEYHDRTAPFCDGKPGQSHPRRGTFQVRFIAACPKGHLVDFPWLEWVFEGNPDGWESDGASRWLSLKSSGSASLMGMQVSAEERRPDGGINIVKRRPLAGAFGVGSGNGDDGGLHPLSRLGVRCDGSNPVLARGTELRPAPGCGEQLHVILKNASNIYFPKVVSSIYIPEVRDASLSPELLDLLDEYEMRTGLRDAAFENENGLVSKKAARRLLERFHPEAQTAPETLAAAANEHLLPGILFEDHSVSVVLEQCFKTNGGKIEIDDIDAVLKKMDWEIDPERLLPEIERRLQVINGGSSKNSNQSRDSVSGDEDAEEQSFRQEEYRIFSEDQASGYSKRDLDIRSRPISEYEDLAGFNIRRIACLHKLRETRAFDGFTRIQSAGMTRAERRALFVEDQTQWLPAIIVRGEGIFIEFDREQLSEWERAYASSIDQRLEPLRRSILLLAHRRNQQPTSTSPSFVLLHTFAHLLINELVQECGYGSASLRERIYFSAGAQPMSGVLIYTAAGDSEGTMGGLVRMGEPDRLGAVIRAAISRARWCSADPVCIESTGQGPGNCNLAACHSCALLPETSCEEQNRKLDRAMLVGTLDNPATGFFSKVISS